MRTITSLVLAAALVAGTACQRGVQSSTPATDASADAGTATVMVTNQRFYDMTIYVAASGGGRTRLGTATGNSTTRFTIPAFIVNAGGQLQFTADPIGPSGVSRSEELRVLKGDVVSLTLTP